MSSTLKGGCATEFYARGLHAIDAMLVRETAPDDSEFRDVNVTDGHAVVGMTTSCANMLWVCNLSI
eukprot:2976175-Amphidinium_carterae.1